LLENDKLLDTRTNIDRTQQTWNYTPTTTGEHTLKIRVGETVKTLTLNVNAISINNT